MADNKINMQPKVELFDETYKNYKEDLYEAIRKENYGEDIGQTSWLTADEYKSFFSLLNLSPDKKVLEIASGSGGPAIFMVKETGCHLTGVDINKNGIENAERLALENGLAERMKFIEADASKRLPFSDESFDVIISIDSINHFKDRLETLKECYRLLKKGGQLLYTDAVVITGVLTNEEIAIRSSLGFFLFVPAGENERLLNEAGFSDVQATNVTDNIVMTSLNWLNARQKRESELLKFETKENFEGLQLFFKVTHKLSSEKRLSRFMYTAIKK